MREKSPCAALNRTPSANGGAVPASDHLSIARRSAQADDHATKTLLFEAPLSFNQPVFAGVHYPPPRGISSFDNYLGFGAQWQQNMDAELYSNRGKPHVYN